MTKNKKKIGLIGCGKWGKKVIKVLKEISIVKFICNSKSNYKLQEMDIDWIFVLTPDQTHFQIVKFFLNKKKNVFCEKPLTQSLRESKLLFKIIEFSSFTGFHYRVIFFLQTCRNRHIHGEVIMKMKLLIFMTLAIG